MERIHPPSVGQLDDNNSDYGSDFASDEEGLLDQLLSELPTELGADPKLVVKDIEDDEGPRGARVPRVLGQERPNRSEGTSWQRSKTSEAGAVEAKFDGGSSTTTGKLFEMAYGRAD